VVTGRQLVTGMDRPSASASATAIAA